MSQRELYCLSRDEIRAFTRTSNAAGAYAIVSVWLVIAAMFVALALWPHPLVFVAAVVVLGGRQLALAVAMHDAAHRTLFRGRELDLVVDLACAAPVWSDTRRYREHHLGHHAHTGTARDPDLGLAPEQPMSRGSLARKIARDLSGVAGLRRVIGLLLIDFELLEFDVSGKPRRARRRGLAAHLRAGVRNLWKPVATNVVLALVTGWMYWAWVVAYLTTFSLFMRVRSLAEHACLPHTDDPLRNTRTTRASLLARATVAPLHVNYHLEHHLLPTVPWHRLPALARTLAARGVIPHESSEPSYRTVLQRVSAG